MVITDFTNVSISLDELINPLLANQSEEFDYYSICRAYDFATEAVLMGLLCIFGFAGNSLSMVCLWRDKSKSSTPFLLVSLGGADTLFLMVVFPLRSLKSFHMFTRALPTLKAVFPYLGKFLYPTALVAMTATIYLTVLVTVNRYLCVCRPYDNPNLRSVQHTRKHVLAVFVFSFLYNLPRYFEYDVVTQILPGSNRTLLVTQSTSLSVNRVYLILYCKLLYSLIMFLIPLTTLIILNYQLIRLLRITKKKRSQLLGKTQKSSLSNSTNTPPTSGGRSEDDITFTLVVVVLVFVVCQTPALVAQLLPGEGQHCPSMAFFYGRISDTFVVANSSVNFIIYCLCSQTFRHNVLTVLCVRTERKSVLSGQSRRSQQENPTRYGATVGCPRPVIDRQSSLEGVVNSADVIERRLADDTGGDEQGMIAMSRVALV